MRDRAAVLEGGRWHFLGAAAQVLMHPKAWDSTASPRSSGEAERELQVPACTAPRDHGRPGCGGAVAAEICSSGGGVVPQGAAAEWREQSKR